MNKKVRKNGRKILLIASVVIVLVVAGIITLKEFRDHNNPTPALISSLSPANNKSSTSNTSSDAAKGALGAGNNTTPSDKDNIPAVANSGPPIMPSGPFVSNHMPRLSGSTTYRQEQSVCNTTPGSTCYIEFSKDGVVKRLATESVNSQGSAYWSWDVGQSGLTQGSWNIMAVASLNNQSSTAQDINLLEVQP